MPITAPDKVFLDVVCVPCMTNTIHYVTKLIFNEYLKTSYNWLTFQCFLLILKQIITFLHLCKGN